MSSFSYFSKIKDFLNREYNVSINIEKLGIMIDELFDDYGNIKNKEKLTLLNNTFDMMFGINFTNILEIIKEGKMDTNTIEFSPKESHNLLIKKLNRKIENQEREINILKETVNELRTNYWNLKQSTLCRN